MDAERVANALAVLQAEGFAVTLNPDAAMIRVGTLEVVSPDSPGTSHKNTRVIFDGHEITRKLSAITVHLKVGEVNRAEIIFGVVP